MKFKAKVNYEFDVEADDINRATELAYEILADNLGCVTIEVEPEEEEPEEEHFEIKVEPVEGCILAKTFEPNAKMAIGLCPHCGKTHEVNFNIPEKEGEFVRFFSCPETGESYKATFNPDFGQRASCSAQVGALVMDGYKNCPKCYDKAGRKTLFYHPDVGVMIDGVCTICGHQEN